jgi:hypothetical protein
MDSAAAETAKRPAKGGDTFDFCGMPDERFERMNALIIKLEHPRAFKPANVGDGGADMVLAKADGSGYEHCWQSKHFPKKMYWDKCEKSLAKARKRWNPENYTFIFPRELSATEEKTFQKKFGGLDIKVDYLNSVDLEARLIGSTAGDRIVRRFFDDPELHRERTYQAIQAGGRLDNPLDAMDRTANIGAFLAGEDPYFSYPVSTHEPGTGTSPPLDAIMSLTQGNDTVHTRLDVVPRDPDAMDLYAPRFVLQPREGEDGEHAAELLQEAMAKGEGIAIDRGLEMTFTRLPPGLEDYLGKPITGQVELRPVGRVTLPPAPWRARLSASSAEGEAALDVELKPIAAPPDGWDAALRGESAGLTVTLMFRAKGEGGQLGLQINYRLGDAPVREQLAALTFACVTTATGTVTITDIGDTGRPDVQMPTAAAPLRDDLRELLVFFENVRRVEEWAGIEYDVPEELTGQDLAAAAELGQVIRDGGRDVIWRHFEITVSAVQAQALHGASIRVEQPVQANLLGRTDQLGFVRLDLTDFKVVSEEPADTDGEVRVRIEPTDEKAANVFERLVKERTVATDANPQTGAATRTAQKRTTRPKDSNGPGPSPKRRRSKKPTGKTRRGRRK